MLQLLFAVQLKWLPTAGRTSLVGENAGTPGDIALHLIMPAIVLSLIYIASWARYARSNFIEVMNQDYIRTARAKGVKNRLVILSHALKNALIPIVTLVGTDFGYMLTGSMLIEKVFSIPGIGKLAVDSMSNRDLPLLEGTVMYIAFVFVIVNLIVDISYAFLDPRIRIGKGEA